MTLSKLNYLCLSIILVIFTLTVRSQSCINSKYPYEKHLGTKTPYRIVANYSSREIKYNGCRATKLWTLIRHGTRNPNIKLIDKITTRLSDIRDQILENLSEATNEINNSDLDLFRSWSSKLKDKDEKKLTHEGEDEMLLLAERMQNRFPGILGPAYSESAYYFKFTATQRTRKSAQYFAAGLFGKNIVRSINFPEPLKRDPILRFYKLCKKWRSEVSKNPGAIIERRKYESGTEISKTIEAVNQRLGFTDELDFSDIHMIYMMCAFETAWNKRKRSPWCASFNVDDLKVLEYAEDLKYYWVDGYGHELTYKQACPAMMDLLEFFQNNETLPRATFYFTHSGTLLKMLAYLQLYKEDKPLLAKDFETNMNRKWRVSQIDSFGTNLAFVLYNCEGEQKVLTLHQENIIRLPSCPNSDLCDIESFLNYYTGGQECTFDEICDNE